MSDSKSSGSWPLALVALGVVFGDIGTSPLYALRECLAHMGFDPSQPDPKLVYGPVSLMFWSLTIMVAFKYLLLLSRATNQGEGGMFALLSLLRSREGVFSNKGALTFSLVAMFGASLLYGDGMITPAISVMAAVEGLSEINPSFGDWVVPVSSGILLGLFMVQRFGTAKIGASFGPIMIVWFSVLGALGVYRVIDHPEVFMALSPHWGIDLLLHHGWAGLGIMGMVLLAVTGCEALYADIGHFGRKPLMRSWFCVVYPGLTLNYLGQTALIAENAVAAGNPFFRLAPQAVLVPLIILATAATIIASQAMITGVFSLTQQAVQLGYLPRMKIVHTNPNIRGQIYMPQVNYLVMVCCLALVFFFESSSNLAAAYGLSVSLDMFLTSVLFGFVAIKIWEWTWWKVILPVGLFVLIELGFIAGSMSKFLDGAWFPLVVGFGIWLIMKTWTDGRTILYAAMLKGRLPVSFLVDEIKRDRITRVPGTAVFMSASAEGLPMALMHHLKHNKALHQHVVLLTVKFEDRPHVPEDERCEIEEFHEHFFRVNLHYGFAESTEVFGDLCVALDKRSKVRPHTISFYQSRELLLTSGEGQMMPWRKALFAFLSRLARPATGYFELPPRQVIELGIQLEL